MFPVAPEAEANMASESVAEGRIVETRIPARLDRLPWARWHWMVLVGLGTVWILDGLEVTIVGTISSRLTEKGSGLEISDSQVGLAAAIYVAGACLGALFFGWLADRLGRKKLFLITLALYILATVATAFSTSFLMFGVFRFFTGAGIGGEYAAINSAIDELIPARVRGRVALAINGSWWVGAAGSALASYALLNWMSTSIGWRLGFGVGATLALCILAIRRFIPESPRWLLTHGRADEAEEVVRQIEAEVEKTAGPLPEPEDAPLAIEQREHIGFVKIAKYVAKNYPARGILGLSLMTGQAFLYNAIFFTYTLVLTDFMGVSKTKAGLFLIPFAVGNFFGPLLLGPLFDTIGRKAMISSTYITSGVLLIITGQLFVHHVVSATTMTICWSVIFFFASAGASAAYLTVSELFPMEVRAMAIALFYSVGTGFAILSPTLFGALIATKSRTNVDYGYLLGAALMIGAGLVAVFLAVNAERRSLEDIARPLTAVRERVGGRRTPTPAGARAR
jgi:MFS family permease